MTGRHTLRTVRARSLWEGVVQSAYECAEPGVIFIDRVRALDNLGYARVFRHPRTGSLVVDTDSLRRGGFEGIDDFGEDLEDRLEGVVEGRLAA